MSRIFIISDTHFFHTNIIKYCNRPFKDAAQMNIELIQKWNSVVGTDDIVYHLGDFAFGNINNVKSIVSQLHGRIKLIKGNHDKFSNSTLRGIGFAEVYDKPIIINDFIILSHEPMFINANCPYINIFGHVHDSPDYKTISEVGACVSAERIDYTPVLLSDIIEKIQHQKDKNN